MNIYENCPILQNNKFILRPIDDRDLSDLFKVYSDKKAVPFFNGDNCHGDDFYYATLERMSQALDFWKQAYENGWFVRFAIVDKTTKEAIGTIEEFLRNEKDYYTDCGLIRLDLRSDYENTEDAESILSLITIPSFEMFGCKKVATKAIPSATERITALKSIGYVKSDEPLIGHDGTKYYDYYVFIKKQ